MTPVSDDLLWLMLDDDTGRLLIDRPTAGRASTAAAFSDIAGGATPSRDRSLSPRRLRERSLWTLHSTHRVRRSSIRWGRVVPRTVWPTVDLLGKQNVRCSLQRALFDAQPSDYATRALIAILHTADALAVQFPRWSQRETAYWARQFIAQHDDCVALVESLHRLEREALADTLGLGAGPLFAPRGGPTAPIPSAGSARHRVRFGRRTAVPGRRRLPTAASTDRR